MFPFLIADLAAAKPLETMPSAPAGEGQELAFTHLWQEIGAFARTSGTDDMAEESAGVSLSGQGQVPGGVRVSSPVQGGCQPEIQSPALAVGRLLISAAHGPEPVAWNASQTDGADPASQDAVVSTDALSRPEGGANGGQPMLPGVLNAPISADIAAHELDDKMKPAEDRDGGQGGALVAGSSSVEAEKQPTVSPLVAWYNAAVQVPQADRGAEGDGVSVTQPTQRFLPANMQLSANETPPKPQAAPATKDTRAEAPGRGPGIGSDMATSSSTLNMAGLAIPAEAPALIDAGADALMRTPLGTDDVAVGGGGIAPAGLGSSKIPLKQTIRHAFQEGDSLPHGRIRPAEGMPIPDLEATAPEVKHAPTYGARQTSEVDMPSQKGEASSAAAGVIGRLRNAEVSFDGGQHKPADPAGARQGRALHDQELPAGRMTGSSEGNLAVSGRSRAEAESNEPGSPVMASKVSEIAGIQLPGHSPEGLAGGPLIHRTDRPAGVAGTPWEVAELSRPDGATGSDASGLLTDAPVTSKPAAQPEGRAEIGALPLGPGHHLHTDQATANGRAPMFVERSVVPQAPPPDLSVQLSQAVSSARDNVVELALAPEELGKVKLLMSAEDGAMRMTIQAERPETLDMMRRHIDQLSRDFRDLGYSNISFSFDRQQDRAPSSPFLSEADRDHDEAEASGETISNTARIRPSVTGAMVPGSASAGLDLRL